MIKYYAVDYSKDEKIIGKGNLFECEITNSDYFKFLDEYLKDILKNHFEMFKTAKDYEKIPTNLTGKVNKKKKIVDVYYNTAFLYGQRLIISEKIKAIFEELRIQQDEYFLKKIHISNIDKEYYLLLVPTLNFEKCSLDYTRSIYFNYDKLIKKKFDNREKFLLESDYYNYHLQLGYTKNKLKSKDILSTRFSPQFYFSERLVNALAKANVLGLDIYEDRVLFVEE